MDISTRKISEKAESYRSQSSLALILCRHNEFRAAFEQFLEIQKKNLFNERNWGNIGSSFLAEFLWNSGSNEGRGSGNASQVMSGSMYNSNLHNASRAVENEKFKRGSYESVIRVSDGGRKESECVLAEIASSCEFLDFLKQKENQDHCKMALSCLKRFISYCFNSRNFDLTDRLTGFFQNKLELRR